MSNMYRRKHPERILCAEKEKGTGKKNQEGGEKGKGRKKGGGTGKQGGEE